EDMGLGLENIMTCKLETLWKYREHYPVQLQPVRPPGGDFTLQGELALGHPRSRGEQLLLYNMSKVTVESEELDVQV
ncbi:hypothetical protein P7K49_027203, partial [Saguinus oedipus]